MPDVQTYYPASPWEAVQTNQRNPHYFPTLYDEYQKRSIYNRFIQVAFNHNGPQATELVVTSLLMPHVNHEPVGLRQQWLSSAHMDSFDRTIRFRRYANKMSYDRYSDMITYWERNGVRGLNRIIREGLGRLVTETMEKVSRDAFLLEAPFSLSGSNGGFDFGRQFDKITTNDTIRTELMHDIRLGLAERYNPIANEESASLGGEIIVVTSPGVIRDLRFEADQNGGARGNTYIETKQYADPRSIITGEVGTYAGVRFLQHAGACLYNAGSIIHRGNIIAPITAGDGAPDPESSRVDGVERVGQSNATHHVLVNDTSGFQIGDMLTIHQHTTNEFGVTNGVDYRDGSLINLRVVGINGQEIQFERPVMEPFDIDLGGGIYGYITKATNVHTMLFLNSRDGIVMGVKQAPTIHTPRPFDDLEMIQRISFSSYVGMNVFNKHAMEVVYLSGSNRVIGPRYRR